jgi:hypothetical protein
MKKIMKTLAFAFIATIAVNTASAQNIHIALPGLQTDLETRTVSGQISGMGNKSGVVSATGDLNFTYDCAGTGGGSNASEQGQTSGGGKKNGHKAGTTGVQDISGKISTTVDGKGNKQGNGNSVFSLVFGAVTADDTACPDGTTLVADSIEIVDISGVVITVKNSAGAVIAVL